MNKHVKLAFVLLSLLPCLSLSAYALKDTDSSVSASLYTLNGVGGSYVYTPENLQNAPNLGTHAGAAPHQAPAQPAVAESPATTLRQTAAAAQERQVPTPVAQASRKFHVVDQTVRLSAAPESALTAATAPTAGATQPAGSRAAALSRNAQASAVYAARPAAPAAAEPAHAAGAAGATGAGTARAAGATGATGAGTAHAAGAASAGTARLNGIKLLAAPYLRDQAHAALTQGAQERLAALGGREVTAALLQRALSDVTRYYRAQGFTGAQAYFPVQTASDGVLSMVVAAPVLNTVSVENQSGVRDSYLDYLLGGVKERSGAPIEHEALNNQLLKLTDLGVFSLQGQFSANDVHGLSHDLELLAQPQRDPVEFSLFADNEGTESSGRYRFGGMLDVSNPTGSADRLALFYARTNEQQNNYSLTYELPVNSHPTVLGLDFCYSNYELSQAYEVLGAQGHEYSGELYFKEPVYRSATAKAIWRSGVRYRDLTDEFTAFDLEFNKHSIAGYTELSGYKSFPEDHTVWSYRGRLSYGSMFCDDEYELTSEDNFLIAHIDLGFSQWWGQSLNYTSHLQLQLANRALDSSEQMQAGGSTGLRAYQSSALVGDSGVIWSNALNLRLWTNEQHTQGRTDSTRSYDHYEALTLSPHLEFAQVYDRSYLPDSGASAGVALSYVGHGLSAELDFSHGIGDTPRYADKESRISFALSFTF